MRAREFVPEAGINLGNALKSLVAQRAQAAAAATQKDPNASKVGVSGQGTVGSSMPPTTGGTQIKPTNSTATQQNQPQGTQLGKPQGNQIGTPAGTQLGKQAAGTASPTDVGAALSPGKMVDIPGLGKAKIGKQTAQGIEIDTSQVPGLGVPKIIINPKDLMK